MVDVSSMRVENVRPSGMYTATHVHASMMDFDVGLHHP